MATQRVPIPQYDKLREHLLYLLKGDGGHADFDSAVKNVPVELRSRRRLGAEHSPWEVLEHLRISLWDVVESIRNSNHVQPDFPSGYWPDSAAPKNEEAWDQSVAEFQRHFTALVQLVEDQTVDILAPLGKGEGQTIIRKVMMTADHNAYHLGELVLLRRLLGCWES